MPATSVAVDPPVEPEPDNAGGGKGRLAKSPPPGWLFYLQNKGDQGHEQTNGMHLMVRVGSSHVSQCRLHAVSSTHLTLPTTYSV